MFSTAADPLAVAQILKVDTSIDLAESLTLTPLFTLHVSNRLQNCITIRGGLHELHFVRPTYDLAPLIVIDPGVTVYIESAHLVLNGHPLDHYVQCGEAAYIFADPMRNKISHKLSVACDLPMSATKRLLAEADLAQPQSHVRWDVQAEFALAVAPCDDIAPVLHSLWLWCTVDGHWSRALLHEVVMSERAVLNITDLLIGSRSATPPEPEPESGHAAASTPEPSAGTSDGATAALGRCGCVPILNPATLFLSLRGDVPDTQSLKPISEAEAPPSPFHETINVTSADELTFRLAFRDIQLLSVIWQQVLMSWGWGWQATNAHGKVVYHTTPFHTAPYHTASPLEPTSRSPSPPPKNHHSSSNITHGFWSHPIPPHNQSPFALRWDGDQSSS